MGRLKGKIALITGAAKGQGEVEAKLFAKEGAQVILTDILDTEGSKVENEISELGGEALYKRLDVSSENEWDSISQFIQDKYGRLDILLNNAGASVRNSGMDISMEDWDLMMNVNAKGVFLGTKYCVPIMQKSGGGSIINISSISAHAVSTNRGDYCVAKAGLGMVTKLFASRLADHGINVYEVCPGVIASDMTAPVRAKYDKLIADGLAPIRRWGEPGDVGKAVVALAHDYFPFTTGEVFNVDGGFNIRKL